MKDISIVAGGSVIAQGLNVLIMPILSRLYSPEDFGVLAAFIAIMSIAIPLSSLRYYLAIALPKSENHACSLVVLSFAIQLIFILSMSLLLLVFGNSILYFFKIEKIIPYKMLLPLAVLGASAYATLVQWAIREKFFWVISRTKISQTFSGGFAKIGLGVLGYKPLGLIIGTIIGQTGGIVSLLQALFTKKGYPKTDTTTLKRVAIKYRKFPLFDTPSAIINVTGDQLIPILIFSFFGASIAGYFSIAQQLLVIPSVFIGDAIGQVFLQRASVAKYEGNIKQLTKNTYSMLLQIGTFPTILIAFFAPEIFGFIFGETWIEAGYYARCIIPLAVLSFTFSPISHVFNIVGKQELSLKLEACYFIVKILGFSIGTISGSPLLSILLFSIFGGVFIFIRSYFVLYISGSRGVEILQIFFKCITLPIISISIIAFFYLTLNNTILTFLSILISVGFYVISLINR